MAVYAGLNIDTRNLIAYYDAGNKKSLPSVGTTWFDLSGNRLNGTIQGNPTFSNDGGGSILFDGNGDYVTLPANNLFAVGTGPFTIHIWYKHNSRTSSFSYIFDFGGGTNSNQGVIGMAPAGGFAYGLSYYANAWRITDYNFSFNNWELATLVGNGGANGSRTITLYRNARQAGSVYTVDYNFTNNEPRIGQNKSSGSQVVIGNIATIAYYSRAFNQQQITEYYKETKSRFDETFDFPQTYYPRPITDSLALLLDPANYSGSGTNWPDTSGNGRDATLINSPTYSAVNGGIFTFNGTTSFAYANTAYVLPSTNSYTIAGFVRSRGSNGGQLNRAFGNADSAGGTVGADMVFLDSGTDRTVFSARRNGSNDSNRDITYKPDLELTGVWHYVAQTYDTSIGSRLYIDGNMITNNPTLGFSSSLTFKVGRDGNASDAWNGDIGVVHIYNKALSNNEIQQNFNAYRGRYGI